MSWDEKLLKQAYKIIELYPQKRSALGPLLHIAQSKDGYISDDSISVISDLVGITEVQVKSVSTFYSMYKQEPAGRYLISVCKSISCEINNSSEVIDKVQEFTGLNNNETDEDGLFSFEAVECIGACGGAPAMQVNYETVEGMTADNALSLCSWLKENSPEVIVADEMQENFGGTKSFDWAIQDNTGATSTAPGFQTLKTTKVKK
tara:strand:- start:2256 stop:2870 length:615 start_codon:yes stop_codon:yes gene_type:complete